MKSSDSVAICKQPLPQCALQLFRFHLTIKKQFEGCPSLGTTKTTIKRSFRFSGSPLMRCQYILINQHIKHAPRDLADFHHVVWTFFTSTFGALSRQLNITKTAAKVAFVCQAVNYKPPNRPSTPHSSKTLQAARTRTACSIIHQRSGVRRIISSSRCPSRKDCPSCGTQSEAACPPD